MVTGQIRRRNTFSAVHARYKAKQRHSHMKSKLESDVVS